MEEALLEESYFVQSAQRTLREKSFVLCSMWCKADGIERLIETGKD
jgi:hypothetical protein